MTFESLTDTQVDRILRKRIENLAKRARVRHCLIRQAGSAFRDLKSTCRRLGAWQRS